MYSPAKRRLEAPPPPPPPTLQELYQQPYDFTMSVHEDIDTFLNVKEFAAIHEIDGQKIVCVVAAQGLHGAKQEGVMMRGLVLLVKSEHVNKAEPGMQVKLDGVNYVITNARLLQGELWRIELNIYEG